MEGGGVAEPVAHPRSLVTVKALRPWLHIEPRELRRSAPTQGYAARCGWTRHAWIAAFVRVAATLAIAVLRWTRPWARPAELLAGPATAR